MSRSKSAIIGCAAAVALTVAGAPIAVHARYASVITQHNDNGRTGLNSLEPYLNATNVNVNQFGKLFAYPVDGFVFAQPLVVAQTAIAGATHNIVIVATAHNSVYAFDADHQIKYWQTNLGTAVPNWVINTPNIQVEVGIISTPVVDPVNKAIYVVAKTYENNAQVFRLHKLDLATGAEKPGSPVVITANVPGAGDGNDGNGHVPFLPEKENQRAALALAGGVVYIAFASHEDYDPYHGWILGYNTSTLAQVSVYNSSPNGSRGGIWQSGQGPVIDAQNNLYFMTGNGTSDLQTGGAGSGECFIKLNSALSLQDYFMPGNFDYLNQVDADLGSGGPAAIPGTSLIVGAGKQGLLYVVDTAKLGGYNPSGDSVVQEFQACSALWGAPVFYNNTMYIWGIGDSLKAYPFSAGAFQTTPSSMSPVTTPWAGSASGALSVSSNGTAAGTGIVWATVPLGDPIHATVPGELYAFDARNVGKVLWSSRQYAARDDYGNFAKFCAPTVANGKVYVATDSGQVMVYGQRAFSPPPPPTNLVAAGGKGKVQLSWKAPAGVVTGYKLYRWSKYQPPITKVIAGTAFVDTTVINGNTYYYKVAASNSYGSGAWTSEVSATPQSITGSIISIDFTGTLTDTILAATDTAGVVPAANWNSAPSNSGAVPSLTDNVGGTSGASISWGAFNGWSTSIATSTPDSKLMNAYLDDGDGTNTTVTVAGLPSVYTSQGYDVYVYCDGDNGGASRTGGYTIGATTVNATDAAGVNFNGTYVNANGGAGNYVVIPNQTTASFTLTASPVSSSDGTPRAPVNAMQIVAHAAPFSVKVKSVSTGKAFTTGSAVQGNLIYIDSTSRISAIDKTLSGGIIVQTASKDRLVPDTSYLTLTISAPGTLYVCYDSSAAVLPSWLSTWKSTAATVVAGGITYKVYSKGVTAGDITLGGNRPTTVKNPGVEYFVIAQPI